MNSLWVSYLFSIPLFSFLLRKDWPGLPAFLSASFIVWAVGCSLGLFVLLQKFPGLPAAFYLGLYGAGSGLAFWLIAVYKNPAFKA